MILSSTDKCYHPPPSNMSFHLNFVNEGARIAIHPFLIKLLKHLRLSLMQLSPLACWHVVTMYIHFSKNWLGEPTVNHIFNFKNLIKVSMECYYCLTSYPGISNRCFAWEAFGYPIGGNRHSSSQRKKWALFRESLALLFILIGPPFWNYNALVLTDQC